MDKEKMRAQMRRNQPRTVFAALPFIVEHFTQGIFRKKDFYRTRCLWCGSTSRYFTSRARANRWVEEHLELECWKG